MPGHTLDEVLAVIDEEIAALQSKPVEARELERAKNLIESENVRNLEPLLARAERLQHYNAMLGDPGFVAEDMRRYRAVEAASVQRYAQQILRKDARVIVTVEPNPTAPIMGRVKK
jgi:zinc protease